MGIRYQLVRGYGGRAVWFLRYNAEQIALSRQVAIGPDFAGYAVMPSEVEQLPDLAGFLKFVPSPRWRRVNVVRR